MGNAFTTDDAVRDYLARLGVWLCPECQDILCLTDALDGYSPMHLGFPCGACKKNEKFQAQQRHEERVEAVRRAL